MKSVTFVCYTSKLCNLRCAYCYELPMLSDPRRMSLEQIERMFHHVAEYYSRLEQPVEIVFQWHGGEPLLIPTPYYREAFLRQRAIFEGHRSLAVKNIVQSNLTVDLTPDLIDLIRDGFDGIGVSLDLFTGLRIDAGGRDREPRAIANLDRLLAMGVRVNGITVLTRPNLRRIRDIFSFYRSRKMSFRLLPVEKGLYGSSADFGVTAEEVLGALSEAADLWLEDPSVTIEPIARHLAMIEHATAGEENSIGLHDKARWEGVLLVDTDGTVYSYSDRFRPEHSPGNVFTTPLNRILGNEIHREVAARARRRMARACSTCPYLGRSCTGDPIAEGELGFGDYREDGSEKCIVARGLIRHLQTRLIQAGVIERRSA